MKSARPLQKGSALLIAILTVALLATIGLGLTIMTQTDRAISRNMASSSKALYSAESGLQRLRILLDYDYAYDRTGLSMDRGWADRWLVVPAGTANADTTDSTGFCTQHTPPHNMGLTNASFFDLDDPTRDDDGDGDFSNDIDTDGDGIIDILTPYFINPDIPGATGTIGADGETDADRLNAWRVLFRNQKERPNDPNVSEKMMNILVVGVSEDYGTGRNQTRNSTRTQVINAAKLLEEGLEAESVTIWNNVAFLGIENSTLLGTMKLFGSLHIIKGVDGTNAIAMSGNTGFFNYYRCAANGTTQNPPCVNTGPDATLTNLLAPQPTTSSGDPTLNSKVRIRKGNISITSSATIGCADDPSRPGKETFLALLMNGSYGNLANLHFDRYGVYDVSEDFLDRLKFPDTIDNSLPYTDSLTGIEYPNYQAYLVGNPDAANPTDYGAAGLDLTPINPLNLDTAGSPWIFSNESTSLTRESERLLNNLLYAGGSEIRGGGTANAPYITGRSLNWLTRNLAANDNPQGNPLSGNEGTAVFFGFDRNDAATSHEPVIGFQYAGGSLTWIRGGPSGSGTPVTLANQTLNQNGAYFVLKLVRYSSLLIVHALTYIPMDSRVSVPFTNFVFHPGTDGSSDEAGAWNSLFPAAPVTDGHKGMIRWINDFLTVPPQSPNINANVDISPAVWGLPALSSSNAYKYPALTASMPSSRMTKSAMLGSGIIFLPGPLYFDQSGTGTQDSKGIDYDGRFSLYVPSWAPAAPTLADPPNSSGNSTIKVRTFLYPKEQFPCNDAIVLMSAGDVDTSPNPAQKREAMLVYARNKMIVGKQTDFAGTTVAWAYIDGGGSGNPNYLQVPALNTCLPEFLPGKDPVTYLRTTHWYER